MRRALAVSAALGLLVAIVTVVRGAGSGEESFVLRGLLGDFIELDRRSLAIGLSLGFTLVGGWLAGELVATAGLPRLSGYLVFGLVFGTSAASFLPGVVPLVPEAHRGPLRLVDSLAIALIALMAGGEIQIRTFRRSARAVALVLAGEAAFVLVPIALAIGLLAPWIAPLAGLATREIVVVAAIAGFLAMGNSPAIVIAVLKELGARGPMRDAVLTTTVAKDLLLIVLATVLFAIGVAALSTGEGAPGLDRTAIQGLAWHLLGSLAIGGLVGVLSRLVVERADGRIGLVIAGLGLGIAVVSEFLHLSPLLVGLSAGFVQANVWPAKTSRLFRNVQDIMLPVSVVFFANAGASIDLRALASVWPLALGLVAGRLALMAFAVSWAMGRAGVPEPARRWAWTGFIAQAGVSLALAREFEHSFADFGFAVPVYTIFVTMIAFHELIGPPLFAWGLRRAGEVPERPV
jgi:Kef-type K+ transport system membrane component KefB